MKINEIYQLLKETYYDWSDFLANPQFIRTSKGDCITWANRVPYMLANQLAASDITKLVDGGQYTFQVVSDGSVFQIYYQYDKKGNSLQSARLAFYNAQIDLPVLSKSGTTPNTQQAVLSKDGMILDADSIEEIVESKLSDVELEHGPLNLRDGPVSWLRIDYEPTFTKGILHHDCHMHLSAFPLARCVVAGVPNPRQFVEFVMAICYPETYEKHRLGEDGKYTNIKKITDVNSKCFFIEENIVYKQITHLRIPIS